MKQNLVAVVAGILFGLGLGISQMIDPSRVIGFLDITGNWDPTLLFVLGGAVSVTVLAFRWILRLPAPFYADEFCLPSNQNIDLPLVFGAVIFGVGWGLTGYCPGPAIAGLVSWNWNPVVFLLAMAIGSLTHRYLSRQK